MKKTFTGNLFALILILLMIFYKFFLSTFVTQLPISPFIVSIFISIVIYFLPISAYFFTSKSSVADTFSIKKLYPINVFLVVLISIVIQPLLMLISTLSAIVFPNNVSDVFEIYATYPLWFVILSIAIVPAICEELFFRGIVFSNYRNVSFFKASIACGFIFGMAHMDGQQFFYAFFMGIVFCYLVYKTGSIFASIISHFTINCSQSLLAYYIYNSNKNALADMQTQVTPDTLIAAMQSALFTLPLLILVFYIFHRYNDKHLLLETEVALDFTDLGNNEKIINAPLVITFVVFIYILYISI
ncbi:MAG: type II CAAX endopeptidase family protein [Lachnospiraceae bacterium]|nr:type II CAAX endopeptidase family protein [Lachnospiraceae bacterium]